MQRAPRESLLVLRAGEPAAPVLEAYGQFIDFIRARVGDAWTGDWQEHDIRKDDPLPSLARTAGIFVTGSSASVIDEEKWMMSACDFLVRAIDNGLPVFGICFGHQLVARALGGRVVKNPRGREIGTVALRLEDRAKRESLFEEFPPEFFVHATHVDTVSELPPHAKLLASTELEPHAVFTVGERVVCAQFHPEFDTNVMRAYVKARADVIAADGLDSKAIYDRVQHAPFAEKMLKNFAARISSKHPRKIIGPDRA